MKDGISLLMIAKNEERIIGRSLKSFRPFVDEMIVADTGSTDKTPGIAKECGAKCITLGWEDDFSKAKNSVIEHASYKWILFADADETLKESGASSLRDLAGLTVTAAACLVRIEDSTDEGGFRTYCLPRLFLNNPMIRYKNRVHETLTVSLERFLAATGLGTKKTEVTFIHTGYLKTELKRKKTLKRNLPLLEKSLEESPCDIFLLLKYGDNLRLMKRDAEALDVLYRAFALFKTGESGRGLFSEVCASLTTLLIRMNRLDEALHILNASTETGQDVSLLYNRGMIYWKKGELNNALNCYLAAERLLLSGEEDPHALFPFILNGMGEMYMSQKRMELSESCFRRSHAFAGRLLLPLFNLMRLYLEKSDLETAKYYMLECERIEPDNSTITAVKRVIENAEKKTDSTGQGRS